MDSVTHGLQSIGLERKNTFDSRRHSSASLEVATPESRIVTKQGFHSLPANVQLLDRHMTGCDVIITLSNTKNTIKHKNKLMIKHFPFTVNIGAMTTQSLNRINLKHLRESIKNAATHIKHLPRTQIKIESETLYTLPMEHSYHFCKLLKEGIKSLICERKKFTCIDLVAYLATGSQDLRPENFNMSTSDEQLDRSADNTGKQIAFLAHNEFVHAAFVITPTELTLSYLGTKGLYFCQLSDLIELYTLHEEQALTVHELTLSMK